MSTRREANFHIFKKPKANSGSNLGPILRAKEVISQFKRFNYFKWDYIIQGLRRILYGLFLKVVIADNIAPLVDSGFGLPITEMSALDVWTLAFLFGLQIYFDFNDFSRMIKL